MRDSRCLWSGSCSLCPYIGNYCPCKDEVFKYYFYKLDHKNSCYQEISHSNSYKEIMASVNKYLSDKNHLKKGLELKITLDGPYSWDNAIRIKYE